MHALIAHAYNFITALSIEQAGALVSAICAVGRLLLQGLAHWQTQSTNKQKATR